MSRASIVAQFLGLALVVVLVVQFSGASASDAIVYDQARDLQQTVSQAVAATNDAVLGTAPPQSAAQAIDLATVAARQLAASRADAESAELRSLATQLVSTSDQILTQLRRGAVDRAEELRSSQLVPLASEIARLKGNLPATTGATNEAGVAVAIGIIVLVVGVIATVVMWGRNRGSGAEVGADQDALGARHEKPQDRTWDEPHPLYTDPVRGEPEVSASADLARTTRKRPIDIELRSLLEATVEQASERDWIVTVMCPEVHVAGDPVRVQRAILASFGNAFLEGAERVGIVVEVVDGQVSLSIGYDAPMDDRKAEAMAERLARQLAYALGEDELGWSVASDGEIYLTTITAGAERVIEAGAEVPA